MSNALSECLENTGLELLSMLKINKTLTHLDLSKNPYFAGLLQVDEYEKLQNDIIRTRTVNNLASNVFQGLCYNTTLTHLIFGDHNISYFTFSNNDIVFQTMLQVNKTLTNLDLSKYYDFTDSVVYCLCQGLQHNITLLYLNLSDTGITDKGAEYIAQALHLNRSLLTLDISCNTDITDDGFTLIAESLNNNKILETLYIDCCSITMSLVDTVHQAKFKDALVLAPYPIIRHFRPSNKLKNRDKSMK